MATNNFFKRVSSTLTLTAYLTTALLAPSGQAAGFYRPQMQEVAGLYKRAAEQTAQKQDIKVLTDAFGPEVFSSADAAFVAKTMNASAMPQVHVDKAVFVVHVAGSDSVRVQPVDLDKGIFKVNGLEFTWNEAQSLEENAARVQPLAQSKGFTMNKIWDLVVPSSHAMDPATLRAIVIGAAVVFLGVILLKMNKNKLKVDEVKARLDAGQAANTSVLDNKSGDPGYGYPAPSRPARH